MPRDDAQPGPRLAFEPTWWSVTLHNGLVIDLRADAAEENESDLVFSVFIEGKPLVEFELIRIPRAAVVNWEGGRLERRSGSS
jgi:hypothetical protein